jgi:hypothetical protein
MKNGWERRKKGDAGKRWKSVEEGREQRRDENKFGKKKEAKR